ncbi:2208_t:CDS:2, partial [Entrophospora sp. SA101]
PLKLTNYAMDPLDWSIANLGKKLKNQLAGLALQPKLVIDEHIYEQSNEEIELVEKKEKRKSLNDELGKFSKNVSTYVDVIVLDTSRNIGFSGVPFKTKVLLQSTTVSFIGGFAFLTMADVEMIIHSHQYINTISIRRHKELIRFNRYCILSSNAKFRLGTNINQYVAGFYINGGCEEEKVEVSSSDYVEEESVSGKKKVMNLY